MSRGASVPDRALAVPVEPVSRLDPAGFDPSRKPPRGPCRLGHPVTWENTQRIGAAGYRCRICRRSISLTSHHRRSGNISAEKLTLVLRFMNALRWLPFDGGWSKGAAPWTISNVLQAAKRNGLCESRLNPRASNYNHQWRFTPLGGAAFRFVDALAIATEARRAETLGSVHEGAGRKASPKHRTETTNDRSE